MDWETLVYRWRKNAKERTRVEIHLQEICVARVVCYAITHTWNYDHKTIQSAEGLRRLTDLLIQQDWKNGAKVTIKKFMRVLVDIWVVSIMEIHSVFVLKQLFKCWWKFSIYKIHYIPIRNLSPREISISQHSNLRVISRSWLRQSPLASLYPGRKIILSLL